MKSYLQRPSENEVNTVDIQRTHKKKPRRRSRFAWFFKLLAVVTLVAAITIGATVFFKVEVVEVVGNAHYTPEQIVEYSGIHKEDNLFALRLSSIADSLEQTLPYLEEVELRRMLPNGVLISVQEWDSVAYVETETGNWLISVGGKILEPGEGDDKIVISGLDVLLPKEGTYLALSQEDEGKKTSLLSLLEELELAETLSLVSAIDLSDNSKITMTYDQRFQVILPMNGDYSYELQVLGAAIQYHTAQERGTFDLTQQDYQAIFIPEGL